MTFEEFQQTLTAAAPPSHFSPYLTSLWYDAKGDWQNAHETIQDVETELAAWVHAYLHRKEGDIGNADYWYRRARKSRPVQSLKDEWEHLVKHVL